MYKPEGCKTLAEADNQIRACIQGLPKTGKTTAAITFPNPLVLNIDRGLSGFAGREDIIEIPFWDPSFIRKFAPNNPHIKDALPIWLHKESNKLEADQTLIIDGSTSIQNAYHDYMVKNPVYTSQGKIDDRAEWSFKIPYFADMFELLKKLKCNVIYICHETQDRDKKGDLNGRVRPLLSGQAGDQLAGHFTDLFRQHAFAKPTDYTKVKSEEDYGMTQAEFKEMCETFPGKTIYVWQTQSDNIANCGSATLKGQPRYIPANWETFKKYMKK